MASEHHTGPDGSGSGPTTTRAFRPGPGFVLLVAATLLVIVLALAAAVSAALGARGVSGVLGGIALVIVGSGLLALLRVPARSLVVNAPRLRLERNRARVARRRARAASAPGRSGTPTGPAARSDRPGHDLAVLTVPGTEIALPPSSGERELTTLDIVSGPVTTALAASAAGRAADARLAGTTTGEGLARVAQLLAGSAGFLLVALGLASVLRQVLA